MWISMCGTGMGKGEARGQVMEICHEAGMDAGVSIDIERGDWRGP